MIETLLTYLSWAFLAAGAFFFLVGAIGLFRMPDLFTRMHAVSVMDTMGAGLMLTGMMLQAGLSLISLKLLFLLGLFVVTGPVATHALARAALSADITPKLAEDRTQLSAGSGGPEPKDKENGGKEP